MIAHLFLSIAWGFVLTHLILLASLIDQLANQKDIIFIFSHNNPVQILYFLA